MSILDQLGGVLQQYGNGGRPANPEDATQHYTQVASHLPTSALSGAIAQIFRSSQTGTFGQNVSSMFERSNPNQRAGILNTLLGTGTGSGALSTLASILGIQPGTRQVTPEQAQQIPPQAVEQAADRAQSQDPSIVQRASEFYAQHPMLVRALGAGAAIMALQHISEHR